MYHCLKKAHSNYAWNFPVHISTGHPKFQTEACFIRKTILQRKLSDITSIIIYDKECWNLKPFCYVQFGVGRNLLNPKFLNFCNRLFAITFFSWRAWNILYKTFRVIMTSSVCYYKAANIFLQKRDSWEYCETIQFLIVFLFKKKTTTT